MLLPINPEHPQPRLIQRVVEILQRGGVIAYPTDTAYGIACDIEVRKSYDRVYGVRKRGSGKPLTLICSDLEMVSQWAVVGKQAFRILKHTLPGPYTYILPCAPSVPRSLMPKRREVGIRVPDNRVCMAIVQALGRPLVSGTAQLGDSPPMVDPYEVEQAFGNQLDLVVDSGLLPGEMSSVVSLQGDEPKVIRKGKGNVESFTEEED